MVVETVHDIGYEQTGVGHEYFAGMAPAQFSMGDFGTGRFGGRGNGSFRIHLTSWKRVHPCRRRGIAVTLGIIIILNAEVKRSSRAPNEHS